MEYEAWNIEKQGEKILHDLGDDFDISPQKIAVIMALLFRSMYVQSMMIDKNQNITITLCGSLKRPTNKIETEKTKQTNSSQRKHE